MMCYDCNVNCNVTSAAETLEMLHSLIIVVITTAGQPGVQGFKGQAGDTGPQGFAGPTGQPGQPGRIGDPGNPGAVGSQGFTGSIGQAGPIGAPGLWILNSLVFFLEQLAQFIKISP